MTEPANARESLLSQLSLRMLAHELKAPLNAVDGYIDMLRRSLEPERKAWILERCELRLAGMRQMIDDLIALARTDECGETVTVAELLRSVADGYREMAETAGIRLVIPSAERIGTELAERLVPGTGREMEIILGNLVSNAIRYNRPGGEVRLRVDGGGDGERLRWTVSDTGMGIPSEDISRVMEAFVRVRRPETDAIPGSGLGLWIVRQLVQRCGGTLGIESMLEKGTTFTVIF